MIKITKVLMLGVLCSALLCWTSTNSYAQTDVVVNVTPASFPVEISWTLTNSLGDTVVEGVCASYSAGAPTADTLTLTDGETYTFSAFDDYGDGWNGGIWSVVKLSCGGEIAGGSADNASPGDFGTGCSGLDLEEAVSFDPGDIAGCTNPSAPNYDPCATTDDGSCVSACGTGELQVEVVVTPGSFAGEIHWELVNSLGDTVASRDCGSYGTASSDFLCLTLGETYTFNARDDWGDGWNGGTWSLESACGTLAGGIADNGVAGDAVADCDSSASDLEESVTFTLGLGCTDSTALNYNPCALVDDGSCIAVVLGCTDPCGANYNPLANTDDGSCTFPVPTNDDCSAAPLVGAGDNPFNTINSTGSDITSCTFADSLSVWFCYVIPDVDTVNFNTCDANYDTGLSLWDACGGSEIACNDDDLGTGGAGICGGGLVSSISLSLTDSIPLANVGDTIYIRIAGFGAQSGCGNLTIEELGAPAVCTSASPPTGLTSTVAPAGVLLEWDPIPLSVACQVNGGPSGGGTVNLNVIAFEASSYAVNGGLLTPGTTYDWRVRCACTIPPGPIDATAFSADDSFTWPVAKLAQQGVEFSIYPNPASQHINIDYPAITNEEVQLEVIDVMGRIVESRFVEVYEGRNNFQFDVSDYVSGIYVVQVLNGGQKSVGSFNVSR